MPRKRIEKILGGLDSARRRLMAEVEGVHEPDFTTKPSEQDWSVSQVIEHLARVDEAVAKGVIAVTSGRIRIERKPSDRFRYLAWSTGAYRYVRIRVKGATDLPNAPRAEQLARIASTRVKLLAAIDAGERLGLWSHSLRHPIFGPMPMAEMLAFVAEHEERHRLQIVRIKAKLAKRVAIA